MRKADLINQLLASGELTRSQSQAVLDAWIEQITNALARGEAVRLTGFGQFSAPSRPPSPEASQPAGRKRLRFSPAAAFKAAVR